MKTTANKMTAQTMTTKSSRTVNPSSFATNRFMYTNVPFSPLHNSTTFMRFPTSNFCYTGCKKA